ncbi:hypothetical protein [Phenylobacterium sp.]|uniref:hypothetical protein n=1 Tax=Phenylobacterium sp. TaxID=1871053 RepID=UPI0035C8323E
MGRTFEGLQVDQTLEPTVNVYERGRRGRWVLVDSFECRVRVRRLVFRPRGARR